MFDRPFNNMHKESRPCFPQKKSITSLIKKFVNNKPRNLLRTKTNNCNKLCRNTLHILTVILLKRMERNNCLDKFSLLLLLQVDGVVKQLNSFGAMVLWPFFSSFRFHSFARNGKKGMQFAIVILEIQITRADHGAQSFL